ncbi:MAG: hypothetical protein Kow0077_15730 [Anaerolineae bacterium]
MDSSIDLRAVTEWLRIVAEPKRLHILNLIMQGVQCNCELSEALQVGPTLISYHLKVLCQSGLVDVERDPLDGRWVYYSINREMLEEMRAALGDFFDPGQIQPRRPYCGPSKDWAVPEDETTTFER